MAKRRKKGSSESASEVPGAQVAEGLEKSASPAGEPQKTASGGDGKIKIRPRLVADKDGDPEGDDEEKNAGKRIAWPSKDPFQAKVPEPRVRSARREKSEGAVPIEPARENAPQKPRGKRPALDWSALKDRFLARCRSVSKRKAPLVPGLAVMVAAAVVFSLVFHGLGYDRGRAEGRRLAEEAATKERIALPDDVSAELDEALIALRGGDAETALKILRKLEEMPNGYSSLSYLVALAAMQNGDIDLAERKVKETIAKRERVSDALALESVLVTQKAADLSRSRMGDPRIRSEALLRQAAVVDAANPYPRFELATLLRYKGQLQEAAEEVRAAQARLNPMDSHVVMDVTLQLIELEQSPDDKLPAVEPQTDDVRKLLPFAYAAMRRGEYSQAVAVLEKCRTLLAPDLFDYLVNDPAFRRFARRDELKDIFGN